jgi:tol-pal system protein YbgF
LRCAPSWATIAFIVARNPRRTSAVPSWAGLFAACVLVAPACAPTRPHVRSSDDADLSAAVERLRLERRLHERKIRDLEHQLASRRGFSTSVDGGAGSPNREEPAAAVVPALPVEVLAPTTRSSTADAPPPARRSHPSSSSSPSSPSSLAGGSEADPLPGELAANGERLVGVADDGSEIVYVDDAASGRVVQPSPEVLAEVERGTRRPSRLADPDDRADSLGDERARGRGDEVNDDLTDDDALPARAGAARVARGSAAPGRLLDGSGEDRIPAFPAPLSSISRRARAAPLRAGSSSPERSGQRPVVASDPRGQEPPVRGSEHGDAEAQYRAAVALVRAGKYPEAIVSFRAFVQRYPSHDYADNAQYWLGEAFYAQRQYETAMTELRRVVEVYPQGNKVPDALLKVGYCHLAMGDRDKGQAVLREVIRLYPKSEPAVLAAHRLEELSK